MDPGDSPRGEPATVIVASASDLASRTLAEAMVSGQGFESTGVNLFGRPVHQKGSLLLAVFEEKIVFPPDLDKYFNPMAYVFLSRHSAASGIASLTAHTTGNLTAEAEFGGSPRELGRSDPMLLKNYMRSLSRRRERVPGYEITLEATHHGPTSLNRPVTFVEIGSSESNFGDRRAAAVVAEALMESLTQRSVWGDVAIGLGGTHYPERFTKLELEGEVAFSFIVPKHSLEHVDEAMLGQMIQRTGAPVRYAALDWKGLGPQKGRIVDLVSRFGLEVLRT